MTEPHSVTWYSKLEAPEPCHRQSAASRSVMEGRYSGVCVHVRASRQAMQKASWKAVFHLPDVPAGMMTP